MKDNGTVKQLRREADSPPSGVQVKNS